MWGVRGGALSHPRLPALWAACRGPPPTGCGCEGVQAWGPVTNPTARALACWLCGLWGRHKGARGGRLLPGVGRLGSGALPPPTARPLGGLPLPTTHWLWVRGGAGVRTCHQPHSARSCELALRAFGATRGCPGGAPPAWLWGVRGQALSHPRLRALWAGCRGPLPTGCGCGGVRACGPVTNPTARALASWLCALLGRHEVARGGRLLPGCGASGVRRSPIPDCAPSGRAAGAHYPLAVGVGGCGRGDPSPTPQRAGFARCGGGMRVSGGGASCLGVGRPGSGALPSPTARPLGGLPGPTTHWLWVGGVRAWGPITNPTARWLCALWGWHEGARGGHLLPGCGASGVGRSPTPDCPPSGRPAGAHYPLAVGARGCGRGDPSPTPQRALLRAGFAGCGGGTRAPGGGASCLVWGVRGRALSHPRLPALSAGCRGPLPTGCRCGGGRAWEPVTNPTARALACWLCALWGGTRAPGGGASCLAVGRPGSGALPPPTARPLGGIPGPTARWLWVWGGAGVGTRHQPHSALALRAVGAA